MEVARSHGIFVVDGRRCGLAVLSDRAQRRGLGLGLKLTHIDGLHRQARFWKQEMSTDLVENFGQRNLVADRPSWKLAKALFAVLPRDQKVRKLGNPLPSGRQALRAVGERTAYRDAQPSMFGEEV
jgi:hypothetical protein